MTDRPETQLKVALRELDVSQAELSRRTGIDVVQINRWCNGLFQPVEATQRRIAEALGCEIDELFVGGQGAQDDPISASTSDASCREAAA